MAVEVIAKIKQINNGTFKLLDACDVEMSDGKDLQTTIDNIEVGEGGPSLICVHEGEPTEDQISQNEIFIDKSPDASLQGASNNISNIFMDEIRSMFKSMQNTIDKQQKTILDLEARIRYLESLHNTVPDTTEDMLMVNEDGFLLVNENNQVLCFNESTETIITAKVLVNEDGSILTNEDGNILCFDATSTDLSNSEILVNEDGSILTNEDGNILCFELATADVSNSEILVNEDGSILTNEDGKMLCFQISDYSGVTQLLINENNNELTNENGEILCLDVYNMILVNENNQTLIDDNNNILKI